MKFTEQNLINSFAVDDSCCDLEFDVNGKTVWVRNAPIIDGAEVNEWYWTDATIQYALENGGVVEE